MAEKNSRVQCQVGAGTTVQSAAVISSGVVAATRVNREGHRELTINLIPFSS